MIEGIGKGGDRALEERGGKLGGVGNRGRAGVGTRMGSAGAATVTCRVIECPDGHGTVMPMTTLAMALAHNRRRRVLRIL